MPVRSKGDPHAGAHLFWQVRPAELPPGFSALLRGPERQSSASEPPSDIDLGLGNEVILAEDSAIVTHLLFHRHNPRAGSSPAAHVGQASGRCARTGRPSNGAALRSAFFPFEAEPPQGAAPPVLQRRAERLASSSAGTV